MKTIIEKTLKRIRHPEFARTLYGLGMIGHVKFKDKKVSLTLKLPFKNVPIEGILIKAIEKALKAKNSGITVKVNSEEMSLEQQYKFIKMLRRVRHR